MLAGAASPAVAELRNLIVVLGDQLGLDAAAFDGFDADLDATWMAEAAEESTHVWSSKPRTVMFLAAMRHFALALRTAGRPLQCCPLDHGRAGQGCGQAAAEAEHSPPAERRAAMTWAQRVKRVFNIDIQTCAVCAGAMRIIACVEDSVVIERSLAHLDAKAAAAQPSRAAAVPGAACAAIGLRRAPQACQFTPVFPLLLRSGRRPGQGSGCLTGITRRRLFRGESLHVRSKPKEQPIRPLEQPRHGRHRGEAAERPRWRQSQPERDESRRPRLHGSVSEHDMEARERRPRETPGGRACSGIVETSFQAIAQRAGSSRYHAISRLHTGQPPS
jgi:hypothetical protein